MALHQKAVDLEDKLPTQRHLVPMLDARYPKGDDPCGVLAKMKSAGSWRVSTFFVWLSE